MKTICIYHSRDLDGWMSAAIVKRYLDQFDCEYIDTFLGWDYGDKIPDLSEYGQVIMCDVCFPSEEMFKLHQSEKEFIWIDHHKTSIEAVKLEGNLTCDYSFNSMRNHPIIYVPPVNDELGISTYRGLRNIKYAACELTWMYFFPDEEMPEIVRLLGMYDSFRHKGTDEEEKVTQFQYAARAYIRNYVEAYLSLKKCDVNLMVDFGASIYNYILQEVEGIYKNAHITTFKLNTLAEIGDIIYEGSDGSNTIRWEKGTVKQIHPYGSSIDTYEYLIEIEPGKEILEYHMNCKIPYHNYKFLCTNKGTVNPKTFGLNEEDYGCDGFVNFVYDKGKWRFTLYSSKVDCSKIAKQYGGGGHKGAAGFIVDTEQMLEIMDHE